MNFKKSLFYQSLPALLAGASIAIAALCNLNCNQYVGAFLFIFGLATVVSMKWKLFTGGVGFAKHRKEWGWLIPMLIFNIIGSMIVSSIGFCMTNDLSLKANSIVEARLGVPLANVFFLSILCGFIMSVSVAQAKRKNWLPLITGIPLFVMSSFPHCIADVTYYVLSDYNITSCLFPWFVSVLGNSVGGNLPTLNRYIKPINNL